MDLRQMEYFLAVAEELHFGRAAERTFVAQPALSRCIKGLEEELGTLLFKRTSRHVSLTDEGAYLLVEVRAILERTAQAADTVKRMAKGSRVASHSVCRPGVAIHVPGSIARFSSRSPRHSIESQRDVHQCPARSLAI